MFLTSLSLRGFKSFADRTTLDVEPGITVIVGPNGSGKSNVVDALAWVMGTAAPSKVRSGQMADVIFAGSPTRSALGSARVEITIDNSDGQLGESGLGTSGSAQQFSSVRVAREVYTDGESSYQINGEEVRALDIQELLSDAGLGRELHTIVGQGQLDEILNARPEERRAFIEEAAGILKHRRRRERALRKLEHVEDHVDKLAGILRELRRQLKPLERQAEEANRHAQLQAQVRDVRLRLVAHDLAVLTARKRRDDREDDEVGQELEAARRSAAEGARRVAGLEDELAELEPAVESAQQTFYSLSSLLERLRGTGELIEARRRHLLEYVEEPLAGRPPGELRGQADKLDEERAQREQDRAAAREAMEAAMEQRRDAEARRREHEAARQAEARRRAEQRERVLRWEGELSALRGSISGAESELERVDAQLGTLDERVADTEEEVAAVQREIQRLDAREVELTATLESAEALVEEAQERVDGLVERERTLERERSSLSARAEALRAALSEHGGGAAALLEADLDEVLGPIAEHVRPRDGAETAIAAALGPLGEAVVVTTPDQARRAIAWLRDEDAGGAVVIPARSDARRAPPVLDDDTREQLRTVEAVRAGDLLVPTGTSVSERIVAALESVLDRTWVVGTWDHAVLLHGRNPELTFVTAAGDVAGPQGYSGGAAPDSSKVVTAAAADEAEASAAARAEALVSLREELEAAREELTVRRAQLREASDRINESDAQITGAAERLARLNKELHSLTRERRVVAEQQRELSETIERDRAALADLKERGPDVDPADEEEDPAWQERADELDDAVEVAREDELERRVTLERITEQVRHLELQAEELRREADQVEAALAEAARRRELRRQGIARCGELSALCASAIEALEASIEQAAARRDELQDRIRERRETLTAARERQQEAAERLESARERQHAAELRRADLEHELEALTERCRDDFGMSADEVLAEHPDAADYDRPPLQEQEDVLVRKLGMLGRVNPLALEEFKALEDRHDFLSGQLEDLRQSKRDLEEVVGAVDQRIRAVFVDAYEDIATEFQRVFQVMFPGGKGRLVLTDPDDMLETGVEVEAQPPGKRVTRLSLLSGGERSLTVLAFVFAIFRARPSPFYVLDEVDAALDDVNLQRLLRVIESFRGASQIIMVTHQKRSMEIADVMYGITMGQDAVTKVVTERLSEREELDAALPPPSDPGDARPEAPEDRHLDEVVEGVQEPEPVG